jgi:hypothetical protein
MSRKLNLRMEESANLLNPIDLASVSCPNTAPDRLSIPHYALISLIDLSLSHNLWRSHVLNVIIYPLMQIYIVHYILYMGCYCSSFDRLIRYMLHVNDPAQQRVCTTCVLVRPAL